MDREDVHWTELLRPGDTVAVSRTYSREFDLHQVNRLTKTQIILDNNWRFRRGTGREVGVSGYDRMTLYKATAERIEECKRRRLVCDIMRSTGSREKMDKLTTDALCSIRDLLREGTEHGDE